MIFSDPVVPTLQQMSFVEVAIRICNDPELKVLMKKYGSVSFAFPSKELRIFLNKEIPKGSQQIMYTLHIKEFKYTLFSHISTNWASTYFCFNRFEFTANNLPSTTWEEMVLKKISCLCLPNIMRYELMSIIRCICIEIDRWKKEHKQKFEFDFEDCQRYFCWNAQGKIDRMKTAKSMINNKSLSIFERFNLARHYGFESDVISLREKLHSFEKHSATHAEFVENSIQIFRQAIGNPLNFRAFFSLLTPILKVAWYKIFLNLKVLDYKDVRFCLSLLEKNEQKNILRQYSSKILQYYLVWPLQNEFLIVSKNVWPFMSIENYIDILQFIIYERIMIGWKDFNYVWLLKEFWRQTPNNFKELVKRDKIYQVILPVINFELYKRFSNEVILENYKDDVLKFHHVGINYYLDRRLFP
ncbi:uncharacterized protein TNIN_493171 [Trichonephila inaurata madagascariensis]|uniref:Uncharacterized protein n=1 Tax=Trichonephila inaurata madagascariensis TaxID=2747483 RepID=A0A8X7CBI6_9ARAC|nr:uncharacterized protein TNIN_493171 [Trichonephila inaurata madagascariensis]